MKYVSKIKALKNVPLYVTIDPLCIPNCGSLDYTIKANSIIVEV